jgi:Family of unknown function (DUF5670)
VVIPGFASGLLRAAISVGGKAMLWTLFVILFILWLLGMVSSYTLGGFIHILLVLAVVALVVQLITGRQPL